MIHLLLALTVSFRVEAKRDGWTVSLTLRLNQLRFRKEAGIQFRFAILLEDLEHRVTEGRLM